MLARLVGALCTLCLRTVDAQPIGAPCMCSMLACCACTAYKCDCILLPALLPIEKSNRKLERPASSGPGFAQGNRIHWLCGQSGANLIGARAVFSHFPGTWFAQGNRIHWLCGQASANLTGNRAAFSSFPGPGFAQGNRIHWICGQASANLTGARADIPNFPGPRFAQGNRVHWLCGQASANLAGAPHPNRCHP